MTPADVGLAGIARLEIAELGVEARAAARALRGREGRIAVGRDVPIVGDRRLEAAAAVEADAGRQKARLALVIERKAQYRRGQDGNAVKAQHRAVGDAFVGLVVDVDAAGLEDPGRVGVFGGAARIRGVERGRALVVDELDPRRLAAGAGAGEAIGRATKEALEALDLELQLRAEEDIAVAAHDDVAGRLGEIFGLVVVQPVGADDDRAAPELDVAHSLGVDIGATAQFAGTQDDR